MLMVNKKIVHNFCSKLILFGWISGWDIGTETAYFWKTLKFSNVKPETSVSFIFSVFPRVGRIKFGDNTQILLNFWWNIILFGKISGWGRGTGPAYFLNALRFSNVKPGFNISANLYLSNNQCSQESAEWFFVLINPELYTLNE